MIPSDIGSTPAAAASRVRLGLDMFSLHAQHWTPFEQLEFAARRNLQVVHFSEVRFLGSADWQVALAPDHLRRVRGRADELGLDLEIGMRSICPTSTDFNAAAGTADEQIARMLEAARILRSPIVRCVLGVQADRRTGIERHIEETVRVLRANRSRIVDSGVKMSVENHAGDLQARELKQLVEAAGPEYVGVTLDSGNPVWAIEDPHLTLETLAPYVLTSHVRDSWCWVDAQGTAVTWTRMGEGNIDIASYLCRFLELCPGRALSLEVIVRPAPRVFAYRDPQAWELFRTTPAWEFARFLSLCERGTPRPLPDTPGAAAGTPPPMSGPGAGTVTPAMLQRNIEDVEASIQWTQAFLRTLA